MFITSLEIERVLGCKKLHLPQMPDRLLICGPNESGKSSVIQSIQFALRGLPPRVSRKSDLPQLVHDGADRAVIALAVGGGQPRVIRIKRGGDYDGIPKPEDAPITLQHVVDVGAFMTASDSDRRLLLFQTMGVQATTSEAISLAMAEGCNADKLKELSPIMRGGFEAAEREARSMAKDAKRAWTKLTREDYGSNKAEGWKATRAPLPRPLEECEASLAEARAKLDEAREAVRRVENLKPWADADDARIAEIDQALLAEPTVKQSIDDSQRDVVAWERSLSDLRRKLAEAVQVARVHHCPHCTKPLQLVDGELVAVEGDVSAENADEIRTQIAATEFTANKAKTQARSLQRDLGRLESMRTERERMLRRRAALTGAGPDAFVAATEAEEKAKGAVAYLENQAIEIRAIAAANAKAEALENGAAELHVNVQQWTAIAEAMSPDGIPSKLLERALGPMNIRLAAQSQAVGWPAVQILPDMTLTYGGRAQWLCSESAQYRAAALVGESVAHFSNQKLLLLDRIDVLDLPGRGQLLDWCDALAADGMQCVLAGTLKQRPELGKAWTVIWLGDTA